MDFIRLTWNIRKETRARFDVQRSSHGHLFESIADISGSNNDLSFQFDDTHTCHQNANTLFYRLNIYGDNDEISDSLLEKVFFRNQLYAPSIFPNPAHDFIQVRYTTSIQQSTVVSIFNVGGKRVKTCQLEGTICDNQQHISISDLPNGLYHLQLSSGGETWLFTSFIKQ